MSKSTQIKEYRAKVKNKNEFRVQIKDNLKCKTTNTKSYVYLLSALFEPIVINGYEKTGIGDSSAVCSWLNYYESDFNDVEQSRDLFQKNKVCT